MKERALRNGARSFDLASDLLPETFCMIAPVISDTLLLAARGSWLRLHPLACTSYGAGQGKTGHQHQPGGETVPQ